MKRNTQYIDNKLKQIEIYKKKRNINFHYYHAWNVTKYFPPSLPVIVDVFFFHEHVLSFASM